MSSDAISKLLNDRSGDIPITISVNSETHKLLIQMAEISDLTLEDLVLLLVVTDSGQFLELTE